MGRWAQQQKRGGDQALQAGLPAGPDLALWEIEDDPEEQQATWLSPAPAPFDFFRARWRVPSVSMLWTLVPDVVQPTERDAQSASPFGRALGVQNDCELAYCDVAGNLLSGWSGFHSYTPQP